MGIADVARAWAVVVIEPALVRRVTHHASGTFI
jgi:hypothetical protein